MSGVDIPNSWAKATVLDVVRCRGRIGWKGLKADEYQTTGPLFVSVREFQKNGKVDWRSCAHISNARYEESPEIMIRTGDILLCKDGSTIGKIAFVDDLNDNATVNSSIALITPLSKMNSRFIYFYFKSPKFLSLVDSRIMGAAIPHIFQKDLRALEIAVPPKAEQTRIVAKIESCFSRIDAIEESVTKAEELLESYRASLLAKAFRGELVAQDPNDEPVSHVLERIRAEHTNASTGKKSKKNDLPPITADEIPFEIPKSWAWVRLGELTNKVEYGSSAKTSADISGVPVLRMGNIQDGRIDFTNLKYLPVNHDEFPQLHLKAGDLLFNRTNSPELVGKCAVFESNYGGYSFASYLIRVEFLPNAVDSQFVSYFLNSRFGREWVKSVMVQQVGQANVNGTKLRECLVPLPPLQEQGRILKSLARAEQKISGARDSIRRMQVGMLSMRNSVLNKAFQGHLVTQIASEGTGHDLLAKITTAQQGEPPKHAKKKGKSKS